MCLQALVIKRFLAPQNIGGDTYQKQQKLDDVINDNSPCVTQFPGYLILAPEDFKFPDSWKLKPTEHWDWLAARLLTGSHQSRELVVLVDFYAVVSDRYASSKTIDFLEQARSSGSFILVLSNMAVSFWLTSRLGAEDMSEEEFSRWEQFLSDHQSVNICLEDCSGYRKSLRHAWNRSTTGEQLALAGLHYEGVVNAGSLPVIESLLARKLIHKDGLHLAIDPTVYDQSQPVSLDTLLEGAMPKNVFASKAYRYHNTLWRNFRGPFFLSIILFVFVLAYFMKEQVHIVLQTMAAAGGLLGAISGMLNKLKNTE